MSLHVMDALALTMCHVATRNSKKQDQQKHYSTDYAAVFAKCIAKCIAKMPAVL